MVSINWQPGAKDLRKFGVALIVGFGLVGLALRYKLGAPTAAWVCFGFGGVAGLLGLVGTRAALPFYWLWMGIAFVMGNVMSRVLLSCLYLAVVTPMALLGRVLGRDRLSLRGPRADSYWVDHPSADAAHRYERQF